MNRKYLGFSFLAATAVLLLSWGVTGHRAIGEIAQKHLSPEAKQAVSSLLDGKTLADVSTWADEVRNEPAYQHTASWHYLNLPMGLSYPEFEKRMQDAARQENVYTALLKAEHELAGKGGTRESKVEALKFIVHFVGDLHQPMHISRAEDKGGNTIQLNYEGQGTNLHALWDSKLIDHQGLTYQQMADKYDVATTAEIQKWQRDPLILWIWESYKVSSRLYMEVDSLSGRGIGEAYYQAHISIIQQRIEEAGIRLAGLLNGILDDGIDGLEMEPGKGKGAKTDKDADEAAPADPKIVDIRDVSNHVNEYAKVVAKVYGSKSLESMTLVNLGAAYPDQLLTVVLRGDARNSSLPSDGQTICVTGTIVLYKGKPEIVVKETANVSVVK